MDNRKNEAVEQNCKCGCNTSAGCRYNPCTCKNCNC